MKPARLSYWDPEDLDATVAFLADHGDESSLLAGGQSLMPMLNMRLARPDYLIDINHISELSFLAEEHGSLRIGALSRHHELMVSPLVAARCPLLARGLAQVGHTAIRYRGTIGGSVAHADPAAELPAIAVALEASIVLRGPRGIRTVAAGDFFLTHFTTAREPDEVLTEVRLPVISASHTGAAVLELTRRHGDFALIGVAVQVAVRKRRIDSARVCAFGVDQTPRRLIEVEALVAAQEPGPELLGEAQREASAAVQPPADMHASSEYRRDMCGLLVRRALEQACSEAEGSAA